MGTAPKITLVGAGGMSFGPTMVNDVIRTPELAGARLVLHDVNEQRLQRAYQFASKLNAAAGAPVRLDHTTDPSAALTGADFVLSSAEFGRFTYRRQDYEIPNKYGARQINGENGGPGAVFHSLRSITNTLSICRNIEQFCPDAFLVNLSNPLSRVALAINTASSVRNVSMCHEMPNGIYRLCKLMRIDHHEVTGVASGINHFTFFTELRSTRTGEDLLPRVREFFHKKVFDYSPRAVSAVQHMQRFALTGALADELYMPLVVHVVREYGMVPCSIDSHIGEYLPFTADVADYYPVRVDVMENFSNFTERLSGWVGRTKVPLPLHKVGHSGEEVVRIIAAVWTGIPARIMAMNVPNAGFVPNLPDGAIVEVGGSVDGDGLHPDHMPPLTDQLAEWTLPQIELQDTIVRAALTGDRELAYDALVADPLSPRDPQACRAMFDELCALQTEHLPF